jgi:hypothetical protein
MSVAQITCCVLPNELMIGSFNRKLVNIVLENIQIRVDIQQASGCFLEKYNEPD